MMTDMANVEIGENPGSKEKGYEGCRESDCHRRAFSGRFRNSGNRGR